MTKSRWPVAAVTDLTSAYEAWPAPHHDKCLLRALVLRVQIEQVVAALPSTVIAGPPGTTSVSRRLFLAIGEPGLGDDRRGRRLLIVWRAVAVYKQLCDLLHGRKSSTRLPASQMDDWARVIQELSDDLDGQSRFSS